MKKDTNKKMQASLMMIILGVILFFPFTTQSRNTPPNDSGLHWWNPEWPYRKLITIDHDDVSGLLANFPVLIYEQSDAQLAAAAQSTGRDITFIRYADNTTILNHEIEHYNHTTGNLVAWVNITSLNASRDAKIWMYYGNPTANDQQHIEETWDPHYLAVEHLEETSGIITDSTRYHNDGTPFGGPTMGIAGKINGADLFDGLDDRIILPQIYSTQTKFTIETWMYAQTGARYLVDQRTTGTGVLIQMTENGTSLQFYINGAVDSITGIQMNTWYHIVLTYDGSVARFYLDGILKKQLTCSPPTWPAENMYIGDRPAGDRKFDGKLDEIRFSNSARNHSWIVTSFNNQNNPDDFLSIGLEEKYVYTLRISESPSNGGTVQNMPLPPYYYNTIVTLSATPNMGWIFIGWAGDLSGNQNPATIVMDKNKTVTALFETEENEPPNIPTSPTPADGSTDVTTDTDLSWRGGDPDADDTVLYDVYFGTTASPLLVSANQSQPSYDPGILMKDTTYYWRIIAWDSHQASSKGEVWRFTTLQETENVIVNITRPLNNSFYIRNIRLFSRSGITFTYGPFTIAAKATSDENIRRVNFYVNGILRKIDFLPPYTYEFDPILCFKHTITVKAFDAAGNTGSSSITVFCWRMHPILLLAGTYGLYHLISSRR